MARNHKGLGRNNAKKLRQQNDLMRDAEKAEGASHKKNPRRALKKATSPAPQREKHNVIMHSKEFKNLTPRQKKKLVKNLNSASVLSV